MEVQDCGMHTGWSRARIATLALIVVYVGLTAAELATHGAAHTWLHVASHGVWVAVPLAVVWFVSGSDEMARRFWSASAVVGFIVAAIGTSVLDTLAAAGVMHPTIGEAEMAIYFPFAVALVVYLRRYQ